MRGRFACRLVGAHSVRPQSLPLQGKVARPKAVTDEGAAYGTVPINGIPPALRASLPLLSRCARHFPLTGGIGPPFTRGATDHLRGARRPRRALCLPPTGGKVAFAEQMTDEGAEYRSVHHPRGYPHQSACRLTASPWKGEAFCRRSRRGCPFFLQIKQLAKAIKRNRTACKFYTIEPQNKSGDVVWKAKRKRTR